MNNCIIKTVDRFIVFKENNRVFKVNNQRYKELVKYYIDKCLIENIQNQKACDYGLKNDKNIYFIELKGKNIIQACKQINQTIDYFYKYHKDDIQENVLMAIIISTKNSVPKLKSDPYYLKLSKKVNSIKIKSKILELSI